MFVATAVVVILLDRLTKIWAEHALGGGERIAILGRFLGLSLVRNPGGAFGVFPGSTLLLFFASVVIAVVIIVWAVRGTAPPVALGLTLGGGVGNLIDRVLNEPGIMRGRVIDFVDSSVWPTFNLADASIVCGVVLLVLLRNHAPNNKALEDVDRIPG